jgi:hypothetical protein
VRVGLLGGAHGVDDALAVPVRRVDDDDVHARLGQQLDAVQAVGAHPRGGAHAQAPEAVLDGVRVALGLERSLMVMRPTSSPLSPTTSSFSMRCLCSSTLAACVSTPGETVMSSRVIRLMTGWSRLVSKRTSRLVRMPTGLPSCTTGRPRDLVLPHDLEACASGWSGRTVMGSTIMPLSARFTFSTWVACSSAVRFLWMMPMPPSRAMSRGGIYLRAKSLKAPGTPVVLEVRLENGQRVLYANAVVSWVTGNKGTGVPGMGFTFVTLDAPSRRFLESAAASMPHARAAEPPVPRNVGPIDSSPDAVVMKEAPSQVHAQLPSEASGRLVVEGVSAQVTAPPFEATPPGRRTGPIIGIDLGTTNSCAAYLTSEGVPTLIRDDAQGLVPSVVALTLRGKLIVGQVAKGQLLTNPRWTVSGFKRLLGRSAESPQVVDLLERFPYEVTTWLETGECAVRLADRVYRLEELSALVLREVKQLAEQRLQTPINRAVITVPAWYDENQRNAVREAGKLAGLHVERIVNEPTAAAFAWGHRRRNPQRVLVYDLGGGTFDASVLELNDSVYEVVSTGGDTFLGGIDFDAAIVTSLVEGFEREHRAPLADRVALQRVYDAAERAKMALSELTQARGARTLRRHGEPEAGRPRRHAHPRATREAHSAHRRSHHGGLPGGASRPRPARGSDRRDRAGRWPEPRPAGARTNRRDVRPQAGAQRQPRGGRRAGGGAAGQLAGAPVRRLADRRAPDVHRRRAARRSVPPHHRAKHRPARLAHLSRVDHP